MYDAKLNRLRCDGCGRFFKASSGTSWMFVPDSALSHEEHALHCVACTKKHGPPIPGQNVNLSVCCGVNV